MNQKKKSDERDRILVEIIESQCLVETDMESNIESLWSCPLNKVEGVPLVALRH